VEYATKLKEKLEPLSKYLGDKKFFVSDEINFPDFHMYELLDILKVKSSLILLLLKKYYTW